MSNPTYEELKTMYEAALKEIQKLKEENSKLDAKLLEVQWMIKNYIFKD